MLYYTYILECNDKTLYTGFTNDLEKRVHQHNNSKTGAHYTKIRRPVILKYFETYKTFSEARKREMELQSWTRERKISLMSQPKKEF
jgi:putative endonuclease